MTDKKRFRLFQVPLLSGAMTHKEYLVIIDCASTNFSEEPNLPPTFREPARMSEISDEEKLLLETPVESEDDKATILSKNIDSVSAASVYTKIRITVDVQQVELDLYIGLESEICLARLEVNTIASLRTPSTLSFVSLLFKEIAGRLHSAKLESVLHCLR